MVKTSNQVIARFQRLTPERRALLGRATMMLALASAAVALLPFRWAIRFGAVRLGGRHNHEVEDCVWAIEAAARRLPLRTVCIEKGIALQRMLRRSGRDARLHYGARREAANGVLEAHVWVTLAGIPVIGGDEADNFAELACFP